MATVPPVLEEASREAAVAHARAYFVGAGSSRPPFTGANFDSIGHRWDDARFTNEITASDLVALSTLSVPVTGGAANEILSPEFQSKASALLMEIPTQASIASAGAFERWMIGDALAWRLWYLVDDVRDMGAVSTSKLLARKRANLVPIYDTEISAAWGLGGPNDMWRPMQDLLSGSDGALLAVGEEIRDAAGVPSFVAPLRVLDAVVWHWRKYPASLVTSGAGR
jgi:hypothetical protein